MSKEWLIVSLVIFVTILISGCGVWDQSQGNFTPEYKDEALKFDYEITGQVLPGQIINMKVRLTNQVEDDINNVELRITDFYGLDLVSEICGGSKLGNCGIFTECGCGPLSIPSLDEKEITFVFRVPSQNEIAKIGRELKPEFTLKYEYHGEATYFIPILREGETKTTTKIELVQSKGPIHVDMERGFTSSTKDWEVSGSQFSVIFRVKDVTNTKSEIIIGDESNEFFQIYLNEPTLIIPDFESCRDFIQEGDHYKVSEITLPLRVPLVCAFQCSNSGTPWVYGTIQVKYYYNYKMVKTETISVETEII